MRGNKGAIHSMKGVQHPSETVWEKLCNFTQQTIILIPKKKSFIFFHDKSTQGFKNVTRKNSVSPSKRMTQKHMRH